MSKPTHEELEAFYRVREYCLKNENCDGCPLARMYRIRACCAGLPSSWDLKKGG